MVVVVKKRSNSELISFPVKSCSCFLWKKKVKENKFELKNRDY